jgi:hypothetical protein
MDRQKPFQEEEEKTSQLQPAKMTMILVAIP